MRASDHGSKVRIARSSVRVVDSIVNYAVLSILLLLLLFGCYSLWDSEQVYSSASHAKYDMYKPDSESDSFDYLTQVNSDVLGWLTVYGTGIDYPLVQGDDNWEYLNKAADGSYDLAGAIFLDSGSSRDFSDYNTIIHGHHMDASAMFGDISKFSQRKFFDEHKYGNLYIGGKEHGIVFFAYLLVDAYNEKIFAGPLPDRQEQEEYLKLLQNTAVHWRTAKQQDAGHIVLLSTCSSDMTNGRSVLAGYLTDEVYADSFNEEKPVRTVASIDRLVDWKEFDRLPLWIWMLCLFIVLLLVLICFDIVSKAVRTRQAQYNLSSQKEGDKNEK